MSWFPSFFGPKEDTTATLELQLETAKKNRAAVEQDNTKKLAEADKLIADLQMKLDAEKAAGPVTEVVKQSGGARRSKKGRRTIKKKRTRRTK